VKRMMRGWRMGRGCEIASYFTAVPILTTTPLSFAVAVFCLILRIIPRVLFASHLLLFLVILPDDVRTHHHHHHQQIIFPCVRVSVVFGYQNAVCLIISFATDSFHTPVERLAFLYIRVFGAEDRGCCGCVIYNGGAGRLQCGASSSSKFHKCAKPQVCFL
jgi:hypothetical protein